MNSAAEAIGPGVIAGRVVHLVGSGRDLRAGARHLRRRDRHLPAGPSRYVFSMR
jgi:hypothetical protein